MFKLSLVCLLRVLSLGVPTTAYTGLPTSAHGTLAPCAPSWTLDGVTEHGFNRAYASFAIRPSCGSLEAGSHAVFLVTAASYPSLGQVLNNSVVTPDGITVDGLGPGLKAITVTAKHDQGGLLVGSFALLFGSRHMTVQVLDEDGQPVPGAAVLAEAFDGIRQSHVTDSSGTCVTSNLPDTAIELSASTADNSFCSVDMAPRSVAATLTLLRPHPVGDVAKTSPILGLVPRGEPHQSAGCTASPERPICQPTCQNPPPDSCDFYTRCAEDTLHCGDDGYPKRYGATNCRRFVARLGSFSREGQAWIGRTMLCLQKALVEPVSRPLATCESVRSDAFKSHPRCYLDSGFCDLPVNDFLQVLLTVRSDLFQGPAIQQALEASGGCARLYASRIKEKLRRLLTGADAALGQGQKAILEDAQAYLERFGAPDFE